MRSRPYVVAAVLALTACTGKVNDPGASPAPTVTPEVSGQQCPPVQRATDDGWPDDVPDVIPRPAGLTVDRVDKAQAGNVTQVRTTVPLSMQDSLYWIVRELPKAGFTLGRGDSEATEIDAPFQRGDALYGLIRVFPSPQEECRTLWVYAVVRDANAPYDISYTPPPSATPLPFG